MKLQHLEKEKLVVNRTIDVIEWELTIMGSNSQKYTPQEKNID